MVDAAKPKSNGDWGLNLLLVLFLDDENFITNKKKKLFSMYNIATSTSNGSSTKSLINRAQSTLSICFFIFLFTILLFMLCTLDSTPGSPFPPHRHPAHLPRRWLSQKKSPNRMINPSTTIKTYIRRKKWNNRSNVSLALQGMGTLFRRGNRAMNELLVAHLTEETRPHDLRWFLRTLHRSGVTAKADVVFIFPLSSTDFSTVIQQENESFFELLRTSNASNSSLVSGSITRFDPAQFRKSSEKQYPETLWGQRNQSNNGSGSNKEFTWGSIVGFEASELDPEDSLSGFLNPVPMQLRRWACYQMLLGRVRRNFKHVMLVGVKNFMVLGDAFSRLTNKSSDPLYLWTDHLGDTKFPGLNSDIIMGGIRPVRRLSNSLLPEIVRNFMRRKVKNPVTDSVLLTRLVRSTSLLQKVKIVTEMVPDENLVISSSSSSYPVILHSMYNNLKLREILLREICSSDIDSSVYSDC